MTTQDKIRGSLNDGAIGDALRDETLYRLLEEMDQQYRTVKSDESDNVEIPNSVGFTISRFYGRRLGYLMALICDQMKEEVKHSQANHDFPKNMRIAWNVFLLTDGELLPWGGDPDKWERMLTTMTEEEIQAIREIQEKIELLPEESTYDYNSLSFGSLEGMKIYIYKKPLAMLCEEKDIQQ